MPYQKKTWATGEVITETDLNHLETQYDEAATDLAGHAEQTAQAHGYHDSQDVVINRSGNKVASVVVWKPTSTGAKRIEAVLTYDAAGKLTSVDEKVYASDGATIQSRAVTTFVRDANTGQILRAEVRPA